MKRIQVDKKAEVVASPSKNPNDAKLVGDECVLELEELVVINRFQGGILE